MASDNYTNRMNYFRKVLTYFIFLISSSCTEDNFGTVDILNSSTKVTITINKFPPEPDGSTHPWKRQVFVYNSYENFVSKSNPIFNDFTIGMANPSVIQLNDVNDKKLYLRVTLWEGNYNWSYSIDKGSYYYDDHISIPDFESDIEVTTSKNKWKQ
jgi:hypothetical protein